MQEDTITLIDSHISDELTVLLYPSNHCSYWLTNQLNNLHQHQLQFRIWMFCNYFFLFFQHSYNGFRFWRTNMYLYFFDCTWDLPYIHHMAYHHCRRFPAMGTWPPFPSPGLQSCWFFWREEWSRSRRPVPQDPLGDRWSCTLRWCASPSLTRSSTYIAIEWFKHPSF